jgi:hypothetical protein
LTPRALRAEEIKVSTDEEALQAAQVPGRSPEAQDAQLKAQERARAQIRVARRAQGEGGA